MTTNHPFYSIEEWIVYTMKTAVVVSFRSFLLFTILLTMIMRLGEAVSEKKNPKEGTSHVGEYCT